MFSIRENVTDGVLGLKPTNRKVILEELKRTSCIVRSSTIYITVSQLQKSSPDAS